MRKKEKTLGRVKKKDLWKLREKAIEIASKLPYETLCRIANSQDYYTWNEEYGEKPEGWEDMSWQERFRLRRELRNVIQDHIGAKALSRHFYKTQLGFTDQQFDDWWDSIHHTF